VKWSKLRVALQLSTCSLFCLAMSPSFQQILFYFLLTEIILIPFVFSFDKKKETSC